MTEPKSELPSGVQWRSTISPPALAEVEAKPRKFV
jgi:hypothetical protein